MRLVPHADDDGYRVFMEPHEYQKFLECTPRDRAEIACRLGGESSLRKKEVRDATSGGIYKSESPGVNIYFMRVWGKETRKEESKKPRKPWVPRSLVQEIDRYCERKNIRPSEPLYPWSSSTLQNDIEDTRERAAQKTGNNDFLKVTFHDLRRYFATNMFYRQGVNIEFIAVLGGWEDPDYMKDEYLDPYFDDVIQNHLAEKGVLDVETGYKSDSEKALEKIDALLDRTMTLEKTLQSQEQASAEAKKDENSGANHSLVDFS
ncbi:site-specific integrase [Natronomonas sp. F2-12]|jgi:integrase|uniref:Site-specific integrase n=1 Tax=Natronomonas aquatica TaxID=2841590 RepID=A0A9R1CUV0_9EURY|nr:site-specific integrase [Natronomonas aquatica]MCQ4334367.1 site-specific integrase [Natronomonas aquatica]